MALEGDLVPISAVLETPDLQGGSKEHTDVLKTWIDGQ